MSAKFLRYQLRERIGGHGVRRVAVDGAGHVVAAQAWVTRKLDCWSFHATRAMMGGIQLSALRCICYAPPLHSQLSMVKLNCGLRISWRGTGQIHPEGHSDILDQIHPEGDSWHPRPEGRQPEG